MTTTSVGGRLLTAIERNAGASQEAHESVFGALPRGPGPDQLLAEIARSGLLGRGGAGFPVARKLGAVSRFDGRRLVVGNGAESEPASHKDALLLHSAPHLVLDGLAVVARASGAHDARLVVHRGSPTLPVLQEALRVRNDRLPVSVAELPHRYVAGESSALLAHLAGGDAKPTFGPHAAGRGSYVGNVETLAQLGLLARYGAGWLNSVGDEAEPGTMLVTLSSPGARPQVLEIPMGTRVGDLLLGAGEDGSAAAGVLIGGYGGTWWSADDAWELPMSHAGMRLAGGDLGAGIVIVLGHDSCPLADIARVARWLDSQSAGQCGPCVRGLGAIAGAVSRLAAGRPAPGDEAGLARWEQLVPGRGACRHPDGAVRFVGQCPACLFRACRAAPSAGAVRGGRRPTAAPAARDQCGVAMKPAVSVSVDPIACTAHGLCAELLPERVALDEWGYPVIDSTPLEGRAVAAARRAAAACPVLAVKLSYVEHCVGDRCRTAVPERLRT